MMLHRILLIVFLGLIQLSGVVFGVYKGTFFGNASFDFSVPLVYPSQHETLAKEDILFDNNYFEQFSMPFGIAFEFAYLADFNNEHRLLSLVQMKYNDDPINFIFNDNVKTKIGATQFSSQNLNSLILFKYVWKANDNFDLSPSTYASFDFNRDSRHSSFLENFYNAQIYGLSLNFKMKGLGDVGSELKRMFFDFDLGYSYNYLPNSVTIRDSSVISIPNTKEDFHSLDFAIKYLYGFYPQFYLNAVYRMNFKSFAEKAVFMGNDGDYSDSNQKDLLNSFDLSFNMGFLDRGKYQIIRLIASYSFGYLYSNHVEFLRVTQTAIGKYPLSDSAIYANGAYNFYEEDFKNHLSNLLGLYLSFSVNQNHSFHLGYSFALKNYINSYARAGSGLNASSDLGSVVSSGDVSGNSPIESYGVYTDKKKRDIFHTLSVGYMWKSDDGGRSVYPYFGMQKSDSNDFQYRINRYIFIFGTKVNYEF